MTDDMNEEDNVEEMITAEQVLVMIPFSRSTLGRLEDQGLFPIGHSPAPHKRIWFKCEVRAWQRELKNPNSALSIAIRERHKKLAIPKDIRRKGSK